MLPARLTSIVLTYCGEYAKHARHKDEKLLQWWLQACDPAALTKHMPEIIRQLCANQKWELGQWLCRTLHIGISPAIHEITQDACSSAGHFATAKWLITEFAGSDCVKFLRTACRTGDLRLVEWITAERYKMTKSESDGCDLFLEACRGGHLSIAQWVHKRWHLSPRVLRTNCAKSCVFACQAGNLTLIKWLVKTCDLSADHLRQENNWMLRLAASAGRLDIVRWLHLKCQFTEAEVRECLKQTMANVCRGGHIDVLRWLLRHDPEYETAESPCNASHWSHAVLAACAGNQLKMLKYFMDAFSITPEEITRTSCLYVSAARGHDDLLQWLLALPSPWPVDRVEGAFRGAIKCNQLEAVRILGRKAKEMGTTWQESYDEHVHDDIHNCMHSGQVDLVKFVLGELGIDAKPIAGNLLCMAASRNDIPFAEWLRTLPDVLSTLTIETCMKALASCRQLEFAQWLEDAFQLAQNSRPGSTERLAPLVEACKAGKLELARWLVATYKPTDEHLRRSSLLEHACQHGHIAIVHWLVMEMGMTHEDVLQQRAIRAACQANQPHIVTWLLWHFRLGAEYVLAGDNTGDNKKNAGLLAACAAQSHDVIETLVSMFQLTRESIGINKWNKMLNTSSKATQLWLVHNIP